MARNGKNGSATRVIAYRRRRRNGKHTPRWVVALTVLGGTFILAMAVVAGISYTVYQSYADDLTPPDEAIGKLPRGGAQILDRNGSLLYQYVDDISGIREPVTTDEMSLYLVLATIDTEDASFLDNPGVNVEGLAAAAIDNFWPFGGTPGFGEGRGGSSITQQLVKNVYFSPEERTDRTISRKLKETVLALELTNQYGKDQILMWYLNLISYGNIYNGAQAAAKGYFGKDVKELTLAEAATLAGIPASPSRYDPVNHPQATQERRDYVLGRMYDEGDITGAQLWEAVSQPLEIAPQRFPVEAPHFVFNVVQPELERRFGEQTLKSDGLVVYTTLDLDFEHKAQEILEGWIQEFEGTAGGHNGAVVAIDPNTAQILSYIGSRDYFNEDILGQNDMADAENSPGSSFKPFTYITAFMELGWGPGTLILDAPISSKYWDGRNPPRNPVAHSGPITARNALGNSLNIPAIKTILSVGVQNVIEQAKVMGITTLDGKQLGPSMTVGGVDVKLADMVYGYTAFPNLGVLRGVETTVERDPGNRALDPISILRVEDRDGNILYPIIDGQPAMEPQPQEVRVAPAPESYMIDSILSDPSAFCLTYGCGGLSIGRPAGFKTGTSEPYEQIGLIGETWTFGYTPQLVVGSWFGNADNSPMTNISSYNVSYRTSRDVLAEYVKDKPVIEFTRPDGLATASVCVPSWLKPTSACPATTPNDLFASRALPGQDDNWWQIARIDRRTGKLASDRTPEQFVEERHYLNIPPGLPEFLHDEALGWAYILSGGGQPPTEQTDESDIPATITAPASGDQVQGVVVVSGRAGSPNFLSYRLEYQSDDGEWVTIMESPDPVLDGVLGVWDTTTLVPSLYLLRLTVSDAELGDNSFSVQILILAPGELPGPVATDTPDPGGEGRGRGRHD